MLVKKETRNVIIGSNIQNLKQDDINFLNHLQTTSNQKFNKNQNEFQLTLLVGLDVIKQRVKHDNEGVFQMENFLNKEIKQKVDEMNNNIKSPIQDNLSKIQARNSSLFEKVLMLEQKVSKLAKQNNKLERKQVIVDSIQMESVVQNKCCKDIGGKIEQLKSIWDNKVFEKQNHHLEIFNNRKQGLDPKSQLEKKRQFQHILSKLQESVQKLSKEFEETEKMEQEISKYGLKKMNVKNNY